MPAAPFALLVVVSLGGCADRALGADGTDGSDSGSETETSTTPGSTTQATTTSTSSSTATTTTMDSGADESSSTVDDGGVTAGFIYGEPDGGGAMMECDIFAQDCMRGEKCMPWANDGGSSWNATKCAPLDPNPAGVGDPCTVEGSGQSGIDNCDVAMMCWDVDGETNMGTCVAFCIGTAADPSCADDATICMISNEGVLAVCLPACHPLVPDCADGQGCYPVVADFVCAPDASRDAGAYGDPCEYINGCDAGLFCANLDVVPGCEGAAGCCSEFCDLGLMDDTQCSGFAGGQACTPWYSEGQSPMGYENVGACAIPP